jgi:SAM-dependent methyltransferase
MDPQETGRQYDAIASWWLEQMRASTYGLAALERALAFVKDGRHALDVGCGGEGRFLRTLLERGFHCAGVDVSAGMAALAAQRHPRAQVMRGEICTWPLPRTYDLITAWDSTFHLPLDRHEPVLRKMCEGLSGTGVLLFTCGGGEEAGTAQGEFGGRRFEYSTLGLPAFIRLLGHFGCVVRHVEYDQQPDNHVYVIAQKGEATPVQPSLA